MSTKSSGANTKLLSAKQRSTASLLVTWEGLLQKHFHDNVEAQTVMFFLTVASREEPIDLSELGTKLGLSKAATSRNYYRLADGKTGDGGLELVKSLVDYNDRRRMLITLTPKGIDAAIELISYITTHVERTKDHASEE